MTIHQQITKQHQQIKELSFILKRLIEDQSFAQMETTCDLFFNYSTKVDHYFKTVESSVYKHMLVHSDENVKKTAYRFMAGSCGIKRIFNQYRQTWCHNKKLRVNNHPRFRQESEDVFKLIMQRLNDEATHLYPVIKGIETKKRELAYA